MTSASPDFLVRGTDVDNARHGGVAHLVGDPFIRGKQSGASGGLRKLESDRGQLRFPDDADERSDYCFLFGLNLARAA